MNGGNTPSFGPAYSRTRQYPMSANENGRSGFGNFNQLGGQLTASDDVYEAARLLHSNQNGRHHGSSSQQNGSMTPSQYRREAERQSTLQYPQPPSLHQMSYDLPSNTPYNMYYVPGQPKNGLHDYNKPSTRNVSNASSRVDELGRRQSVTFGSDEKFRQTHYAAPLTGDAPDKALKEAVTGVLRYYRKGSQSPNSSPDQKRPAKADMGWVEENDEDGSADETTPPPQKKRKRKADEDDEEFGVKRSRTKGHRVRRSSSPGRTSNIRRTSSFGDGHKRSNKVNMSPIDSKANRENLSEEQKRNNHIQSEQKRRNLIKNGFEDLTKMVPELRAGGFSKSNMLLEAAKFMKLLREGNDELGAQLQSLDAG